MRVPEAASDVCGKTRGNVARPGRRRPGSGGGFFVYILECADGTYYTGRTSDLERRIKEHNESGGRGARYTRYKRPVKLLWRRVFKGFRPAARFELAVKRLTRRQKERLVGGGLVMVDTGNGFKPLPAEGKIR